MNIHNTGKEYEKFVAMLQKAIIDSDQYVNQKNLEVEVNKKIIDNCGIEREFDIYWEYELAGLTYKTVIECKDYKSKVSVEKIDALIGKTADIPDLKLVFATKTGYQSGARKKAEANKIDLLIFREQNESDWVDQNGNPLIKRVFIDIHAQIPAVIHKFTPIVDREWIVKNTALDVTKPIQMGGMNNEIIINDKIKCEEYSVLDLANRLTNIKSQEYGQFIKSEQFEEAYLHIDNLKIKLKGYQVIYSISPPSIEHVEIDYSKFLIGVIEYIQKGTKKSIFSNGMVKECFNN